MNSHLNKSRTFRKVRDKSVTLIELIIAVALISLVVLGFSSIDLFSRHHLLTIDKRAQVQNEASYVLEHMAKQISNAIGDVNQPTVDTTTKISGDSAIRVWIDANSNGTRDTNDYQIAYRYIDSGDDEYQIWYYAVCNGSNCNPPGSSNPKVIVRRISNSPTYNYSVADNYVSVEITARWDPDESASTDNPEVTMKARIKMPSVSTH